MGLKPLHHRLDRAFRDKVVGWLKRIREDGKTYGDLAYLTGVAASTIAQLLTSTRPNGQTADAITLGLFAALQDNDRREHLNMLVAEEIEREAVQALMRTELRSKISRLRVREANLNEVLFKTYKP